MIENRIVTWDHLTKRGFVGPSRCALCGEEEETINHLMVICPVTKEVWKLLIIFENQPIYVHNVIN